MMLADGRTEGGVTKGGARVPVGVQVGGSDRCALPDMTLRGVGDGIQKIIFFILNFFRYTQLNIYTSLFFCQHIHLSRNLSL